MKYLLIFMVFLNCNVSEINYNTGVKLVCSDKELLPLEGYLNNKHFILEDNKSSFKYLSEEDLTLVLPVLKENKPYDTITIKVIDKKIWVIDLMIIEIFMNQDRSLNNVI